MTAAELTTEFSTLAERVANIQGDVTTALDDGRRRDERVQALAVELAGLRVRLDEHVKRTETWDNRRWAVIGLFVASLLSLVANLIVIAVRK
jgi:hypothetical protein